MRRSPVIPFRFSHIVEAMGCFVHLRFALSPTKSVELLLGYLLVPFSLLRSGAMPTINHPFTDQISRRLQRE
jgi:hypothetical protein